MLVLANRLSEQLNKRRINWKDVESIIQENRAYINEYDDDDCALSDLYGYFYKNGKQALMLTELFLKHGFDVNANDGKNGASCLHQLCWSLYDQYVVEIAERLLDIGANPNIGMDDEDEHGILDSIGWKLGYWMTGDYEEANMFEAYYLLAERAQSGKKYSGIRAFRNSVGSIVEKVEKIKYAQDTDEGKKIKTSFVFTCSGKKLVISEYVDFIVNPFIYEDAIDVVDVSADFASILGAKIKGLRYQSNSQAKLNFDNGFALLVGSKASLNNDDLEDWLSIVDAKMADLPPIGTAVTGILLPGQVIHSDSVTYYEESSLILDCEDKAFCLYAHQQHEYAVSSIRVEQLTKKMVKNVKRKLDLHNLILEEVHLRGKAIEWIRLSCDEGMFYINSDGFTSVGFYLAPCEIREPEKIDSWTKGLIKLSFPGTESWRSKYF